MSPDQAVPHVPKIPPRARRVRLIRGWMRQESIGAPAVLSIAWALAALAASLLLWGGIAHGWSRAVLLLAAAAAMRGRRAFARLGATMPMDAKGPVAPVGPGQRWGDLAQEAIVLAAAGLCGYGSGYWLGPALAAPAVVLLLVDGGLSNTQARAKSRPGPDPVMMMAVFVTVAAAEPLWGWRGQIILIGLSAVCAVLAYRLYRRARPAAPAP